uniref:ATP synthase complex subunit 8 n=1 Tax=Mekongiana xiangchengensis TaxID=868576 RepID=E1ABS7_9ORTH|nr:ATP synthase F0 subunit 8 [Mekongiana xiangchengensis]ADK77626.1 ATP synthase F0 subunit 8 [Mekongiana xiangchengensis]
MPQMSPMMWLTLLMMFSMTMILVNQYYFFSFKNNKILLNKKLMFTKHKMNWKW